jgi:hypothetical protein
MFLKSFTYSQTIKKKRITKTSSYACGLLFFSFKFCVWKCEWELGCQKKIMQMKVTPAECFHLPEKQLS